MDYIPVAHIRAVQSQINVSLGTWTEIKVGDTRLMTRKWVEVFNRSAHKVYYSYDNTASIRSAFAVKAGGKIIFPISDTVPVYFQSSGSYGCKLIIAELS